MSTDPNADNGLPSWFWKLVIGGAAVPALLICFIFAAPWFRSARVVPAPSPGIAAPSGRVQTSSPGDSIQLGTGVDSLIGKVVIAVALLGLAGLVFVIVTSARADTQSVNRGQRSGGIGWVIVIGGIILFAFARLGTNAPSYNGSTEPPTTQVTPDYSYSRESGKPYDMPQEDWEYIRRRLRQEGVTQYKYDTDKAARAIWKFQKAQEARGDF